MRLRRVVLAVLVAVATISAPPARADITVGTATSARLALTFSDDFNGTRLDPARWSTYDGITERNVGPAVFRSSAVTVSGGNLQMFGYREQRNGAWNPVASAVIPTVEGRKYGGMTYGRVEFAMSVEVVGASMTNWHVASLLWPDARPGELSGRHSDGEVDWPEGTADRDAKVFVHELGATPWKTCYGLGGGWQLRGWHSYRVDWTAAGFVFWRDGQVVGRTSCANTTSPKHWVLQLVTLNSDVPPDSYGRVLVDWVRISKEVQG